MNKTYDRKIHGKLLSALAASERLRELHGLLRTPRTLAVMRSRGGGPGFVKRGRSVAYAEFFIDQWADAVNGVEVREITPVQVGRPGLALAPGTELGQLPISTRAKNALGALTFRRLRISSTAVMLTCSRSTPSVNGRWLRSVRCSHRYQHPGQR